MPAYKLRLSKMPKLKYIILSNNMYGTLYFPIVYLVTKRYLDNNASCLVVTGIFLYKL